MAGEIDVALAYAQAALIEREGLVIDQLLDQRQDFLWVVGNHIGAK